MTVVPRGTDGAVSVVGTFAGVLASIFLAFIGYAITMVPPFFSTLEAIGWALVYWTIHVESKSK